MAFNKWDVVTTINISPLLISPSFYLSFQLLSISCPAFFVEPQSLCQPPPSLVLCLNSHLSVFLYCCCSFPSCSALGPSQLYLSSFFSFSSSVYPVCFSSSLSTSWHSLFSLVQGRETVCPVCGLAIGEPRTVWRNVAHPALLNRYRGLSWMVVHEILPVRAVMHSRGTARTRACPRPGCGQDESVRHLLRECRATRDLRKEEGPLISPCLPPGEDLTLQPVLYVVGRRPIPPKHCGPPASCW